MMIVVFFTVLTTVATSKVVHIILFMKEKWKHKCVCVCMHLLSSCAFHVHLSLLSAVSYLHDCCDKSVNGSEYVGSMIHEGGGDKGGSILLNLVTWTWTLIKTTWPLQMA